MANSTIESPNISIAWLNALEYLLNNGGKCFNLMVIIDNPTQIEPLIHTAYEQMLSDYALLTLKQVTYTIFPKSLYIGVRRNPDKLFERYNRSCGIYDRLSRRYKRKFGWGSYFRRMTYYPIADNYGHPIHVNQLKDIIIMLQNRIRTYKAAYTISIQIPGVDGKKTIGGPCLNFIALQLINPHVLNMLAVYRSHDFIQRAYGNYLGLGYLMEFLCDQTRYKLGKLSCLSSHASIANLAGASCWPTIAQLRIFLNNMKQS
jgi:thymidylate synthase